jgi:hypothetical protein
VTCTVGSSSTLARRLIGYFNGTHKNTGKLIPLIKSEGIGAFTSNTFNRVLQC